MALTDKNKMMQEVIHEELYKCVKYNSMEECKTCDGFGRNIDNKVNVEICYCSLINTLKGGKIK